MVPLTEAPSEMAPRNSKIEAITIAWPRDRDFAATELAKILAE
jgi:hypothetical protein